MHRQDEVRFGRVTGRGHHRECRSGQIRSGICGLRGRRCHDPRSRGASATPRRGRPGGWTMTTSALQTTDISVRRPAIPRSLVGLALLLPALAFLVVFLVLPSLILLGYSVLTQNQTGDIGLPLTVGSYERLVFSPAYRRVVMTTLRVAFFTALFTSLLAYPLAMVIAYGRPLASRITMILVVAPLVVSVIVRTYGWQLVLGNSNTGVLNWILAAMGAGPTPVKVLYTEWNTVNATAQVFLPLMGLPLSASC